MNLSVLPQKLAVLKLDPNQSIPEWALNHKEFASITYTGEELSIVCLQDDVPSEVEGIETSLDWQGIKVEGPLDFSLTGILSSLAAPLAEAKISIFALSTYDTDYLLVKANTLKDAIHVLTEQGHTIN
ncbi:ACT domain-containing protein [Priestia megaterium]|uniref:ACT domain-containing protein n=1 Tax=Priestia megaterium TaxID=1404 RepID=UPI003F7EA72F